MGKVDAMQRIETELRALGVSEPEWEYRFHPTRRWRFDLAWPAERIAIEVDGGTWVGGRHTSGAGFAADCEKFNAAALLGWRVFRFTTTMIREGAATATLQTAFAEEEQGMSDEGITIDCDDCGQVVAIPRTGTATCGCAGTTWSFTRGKNIGIDRDRWRARADALAKALRLMCCPIGSKSCANSVRARAALREYDEEAGR